MANNSDKFWTIVNKDDGPAEILIYDSIGSASFWEDTVSAKQFVKDLKEIGSKKELIVRINSPGGSVTEGNAIFNAIKNHKGNVTVKIDGMALSMASVVAMAGNTVEIADNAMIMVHNPSAFVRGESKDLRAAADVMDKMKAGIVSAYASKSGADETQVSAWMDEETWFDAAEALEAGLVDKITETNLAVAASFDVSAVAAFGVEIPSRFAKRMAEFANKHKEGNKMPENPEKKAATVAELKALKGADSDFVVAQMEAGATIEQATAALNELLLSKLEAQNKEIGELKLKSSETNGSEEGVKSIGSSKHSENNGDTVKPGEKPKTAWGDDPVAFYREKFTAECAKGLASSDAADKVEATYPGLAEAVRNHAITTK